MPDRSELRTRVDFGERVVEADGYGNERQAFVTRFSRFAKIRPRLGGEQVMAGRLEGRQAVNITVRHDSETLQLSPAWAATNNGNGVVYNIRSVVDPFEHTAEHGKWIEILAEAGGNVA